MSGRYQGCCLEPLEQQEHARVVENQQRLHRGNASVQQHFPSFHSLGYSPVKKRMHKHYKETHSKT
jgi:hypothetical protein